MFTSEFLISRKHNNGIEDTKAQNWRKKKQIVESARVPIRLSENSNDKLSEFPAQRPCAFSSTLLCLTISASRSRW